MGSVMSSLPPTECVKDVTLLAEQGGVRSESGCWREQAVFVKTLLSDDPEIVTRFNHEGEIAAHIQHPLAQRLLLHTNNQLIFNFVAGGSLRALLTLGPLDTDAAIAVTWGVLCVLRDLHARGIVHHDIKPENVVLKDGRAAPDAVRLVDFGMSSMHGLVLDIHSGTRMGTPHFMAPEQFAGQRGDPRSDLYSVGVLLFDCLIGTPPYENPLAWLIGQQQQPPVWPAPLCMEQLMRRCLERDPAERPQTADEFLDMLTAVRAELGLEKLTLP